MAALALVASLVGAIHAAHVVLTGRSPEGTIAWALSMILFPWVAVPLYWIFGRNKFDQYAEVIRDSLEECRPLLEISGQAIEKCASGPINAIAGHSRALFESIAPHPFTGGNRAKLLIDGETTFKEIFDAIALARNYILVEYYMFKADSIGREFSDRLIAKAKTGVHVHLIYDEMGSGSLPWHFVEKLRQGGVQLSSFGAPRRSWAPLRMNFRNHRKIVVVDGATAFLGGINVGDEYLSRDRSIGYWRDTHLRLDGPAALAVQASFLIDLAWASEYPMPRLSWTPFRPQGASDNVLVLPTGPADFIEACSLFFIESICSARKRLWLASPYFVPDDAVVKALQLAACRGVEIRIVMPKRSDNRLVSLAGLTFLEELDMPNVHFFSYHKGFMHHKVMLIDDKFATVGTANMDNRSFRLNFEISAVVSGEKFVKDVENMFLNDFKSCDQLNVENYIGRNPLFRILCQTARLFSPAL